MAKNPSRRAEPARQRPPAPALALGNRRPGRTQKVAAAHAPGRPVAVPSATRRVGATLTANRRRSIVKPMQTFRGDFGDINVVASSYIGPSDITVAVSPATRRVGAALAPARRVVLAVRLRWLADQMRWIGEEMSYYGGFSKLAVHGRELVAASKRPTNWAAHLEAGT